MKCIFTTMALILALFPGQEISIYDISLKSIDGNTLTLSQYKGKKLLFLVVPHSSGDTTLTVKDIAELQIKYNNSLVIIGVPSEEAGYDSSDSAELKDLYETAGAPLMILEGMKVRKGAGQSFLFQWLTSKDLNHHFDRDVQGVGSKFFVDEEGHLYAVMGPNLTLTNPLMDRILSKPHKKD